MSECILCDSCGTIINKKDGNYLSVNANNYWTELTHVMYEEDAYDYGYEDYDTTSNRKSRKTFHYCEFCKQYALDALESVHALSRENLEGLNAQRLRETARFYGICLSRNGRQKHKDELIDELVANDMHVGRSE